MLELILKGPNDLELRTIQSIPPPKGEEVKIKLIYGGICGSDLGVYKGKIRHASYPLRPGHELVGTIIEAGNEARYPIGTRVVVLPNTFCGECDLCKKGRTNICCHKKSIGVNADGGFSEEFTISSKFVLPISDDLTDEKAILIEPLAVVVHALKKVKINEHTSVAIIGCGNEGMLAAAVAIYLGGKVTAIDINQNKFGLVRNLGDVRTLHANDVMEETFDVVIEAAGVKNSVEQAIQLVRPGGDVVIIGLAAEANLPIIQIVRNEITIHGSIIYNFPEDYLQTVEYLKDSRFNVSPVISKFFPFTDYKQAYETALSGDYGKVILKF